MIGLILLLVSLAILAWGIWPFGNVVRSVPISPADMSLPTPESWLPILLSL